MEEVEVQLDVRYRNGYQQAHKRISQRYHEDVSFKVEIFMTAIKIMQKTSICRGFLRYQCYALNPRIEFITAMRMLLFFRIL